MGLLQKSFGPERDDRCGVGMRWRRRDVLIPGIVRREDLQRGKNAVGFRRVEHHVASDFRRRLRGDDGRTRHRASRSEKNHGQQNFHASSPI
jgi:hypothetical protein